MINLPLIYTRCLETIWNFLEKIHAFQYTSSHLQNASKLLTEKLPKYSKPRSFRGGGLCPRDPLPGLCPGPAGNLKRSPDLSPTFVPPNTKSWIHPWHQLFKVVWMITHCTGHIQHSRRRIHVFRERLCKLFMYLIVSTN